MKLPTVFKLGEGYPYACSYINVLRRNAYSAFINGENVVPILHETVVEWLDTNIPTLQQSSYTLYYCMNSASSLLNMDPNQTLSDLIRTENAEKAIRWLHVFELYEFQICISYSDYFIDGLGAYLYMIHDRDDSVGIQTGQNYKKIISFKYEEDLLAMKLKFKFFDQGMTYDATL